MTPGRFFCNNKEAMEKPIVFLNKQSRFDLSI